MCTVSESVGESSNLWSYPFLRSLQSSDLFLFSFSLIYSWTFLFVSSISGCTDHFEEDEESALETTRNIMATLNRNQHFISSGAV